MCGVLTHFPHRLTRWCGEAGAACPALGLARAVTQQLVRVDSRVELRGRPWLGRWMTGYYTEYFQALAYRSPPCTNPTVGMTCRSPVWRVMVRSWRVIGESTAGDISVESRCIIASMLDETGCRHMHEKFVLVVKVQFFHVRTENKLLSQDSEEDETRKCRDE